MPPDTPPSPSKSPLRSKWFPKLSTSTSLPKLNRSTSSPLFRFPSFSSIRSSPVTDSPSVIAPPAEPYNGQEDDHSLAELLEYFHEAPDDGSKDSEDVGCAVCAEEALEGQVMVIVSTWFDRCVGDDDDEEQDENEE
ncbi:hypothetical protein HDU67_005213 [Dinochytrium kinnereticum]|nr:hypothetical protein HDU67_005213 [Dinochytrium kinnereticum]